MEVDGRRLDVVGRAYAEAVSRAGGHAHLLPRQKFPFGEDELRQLDGLVLTGGGDVDPAQYGMGRSDATGGVDTERDIWEIGLVHEAMRSSLPVLGICRGCQILNVGCGGTLIQDLPARSLLPHLVRERGRIAHRVTIGRATQLFGIEDSSEMGVNSIHHQAIETLGAELSASAWADDGTIEAVEHASLPMLGVQWHPEDLAHEPAHLAIFDWLVGQATQRAGSRAASLSHSRMRTEGGEHG